MPPTPTALHDFLHAPTPAGEFIARPTPYTAFDVAIAVSAYRDLVRQLPLDETWFALKAAPLTPLVRALHAEGCGFDVASVPEIDQVLAAGVPAGQLSYGNPVRSREEVHAAADRGIRTWVVDHDDDLQRIAVAAPGSRVVFRLAVQGAGADWPLSQRFGTSTDQAVHLARSAARAGLRPAGLAWHVGSLQRDTNAWDRPLGEAAAVWSTLADDGIDLELLDLGGGLAGPGYRHPAPPLADFAAAITRAVDRHFPTRPRLVAEPGRSLVAAAGASVVSVKAVLERTDGARHVFVDGLVFGLGLIEGMDGSVEYRITAPDHHPDAPTADILLQGPTCDSVDQLKAKTPYTAPLDLKAGDRLIIHDCGAYSFSYAAQNFNGWTPAPVVVL
ncbi:hypothetical protein [Streptacidiphilus sp. EB103A]|uniref:hypothetical protein n=1 Tax=Streptacidiphilus sp. EB103A TaxID=3156275 RepID=UPI00351757B0